MQFPHLKMSLHLRQKRQHNENLLFSLTISSATNFLSKQRKNLHHNFIAIFGRTNAIGLRS